MVTVVIADDHEVVRRGVRSFLETVPDLRVVGEASSGPEAVRAVERFKPDVLLLDIVLPGMDGLSVLREITKRHTGTRTVMLSVHVGETYVCEALRAGAAGYVLKDARSQEVLDAIRQVSTGGRYLSSALSPRAIELCLETTESGNAFDPWDTLSTRERETLQLVAEGWTNQEIAEQLFISPRTVETHRAAAMRKLGLRTHSDIVLSAVRHGLLKID